MWKLTVATAVNFIPSTMFMCALSWYLHNYLSPGLQYFYLSLLLADAIKRLIFMAVFLNRQKLFKKLSRTASIFISFAAHFNNSIQFHINFLPKKEQSKREKKFVTNNKSLCCNLCVLLCLLLYSKKAMLNFFQLPFTIRFTLFAVTHIFINIIVINDCSTCGARRKSHNYNCLKKIEVIRSWVHICR